MALLHRAYYFDSRKFHNNLEKGVLVKGKLSLKSLRALALEVVEQASDTTQDALKWVRYHEEWLDDLDEEVSRSNEWYIIALTKEFVSAPNLSSRIPVSYLVLRTLLPVMGWNQEETKLLQYGMPLQTLPQSSGNAAFISEFNMLDQFGGWLSLENIETLNFRLREVEPSLSSLPRDAIKEIDVLATSWSKPLDEFIHQAYSDAYEMLQGAIEQKMDLFLVLD